MTDQELAAELRELAAHPALAARAAQLREVADAVLSPELAERWCEVDLFAAFPPEETVRPDHPGSARWWHALLTAAGLVQPVLVFLPISITWLGLKNATTAYGELLATAGAEAARRPFLELWQQGFDGRLPAWQRFDSVGLAALCGSTSSAATDFRSASSPAAPSSEAHQPGTWRPGFGLAASVQGPYPSTREPRGQLGCGSRRSG
ncbi:hypothetical protein TBS_06430 [Thermobispora bispora]|uniref:hypothetical protein n=1 Tax=Thermobispora bispora TaxID=2006 RepID=UPI0030EA5DCE